ncbi:BirA family biotin operon repressor/biotin-[acetyl-CoA-carboxylase] ligase [Streptohalobacillus salinus]|uniref:Bifunctional ligase/repressor BirA n=1 Tax=Streptohalobacillus salinus TaxID=621096 RepID=A0A2V3WF14_9BACI|nr:biotin--[acetyl-CoA-carboxylase] ligase [Streptohalobacillus salinus]PXW91741.1 BirA family biotin operon repressor/biotin-[acetyl-CoA-carboxylase] ligase [Streptohalobacillus salinus]
MVLSIRERLVRLLSQEQSGYVSGQWLSDELSCSRTAVWKHIKQLEEEGYTFDAVPNKGYRLVALPKHMTENTLRWNLSSDWLGQSIEHYPSIDSTQVRAHERARAGADEGLVISADQQLNGRGRMQRPFDSTDAKGVWLSFILRPQLAPTEAAKLTLVTAVALVDTFKQMINLDVKIKWPNDIYLNQKKIAGVLTEMEAEMDQIHYVIVGIGVNLNQRTSDFDPLLQDRVTSLFEETGETLDKQVFIQRLLETFEKWYTVFLTEGFVPIQKEWNRYVFKLNQPVYFLKQNERVKGLVQGLSAEGALVVVIEEHEHVKLYSSDIEWFRGE